MSASTKHRAGWEWEWDGHKGRTGTEAQSDKSTTPMDGRQPWLGSWVQLNGAAASTVTG